MDGSPYSCVHTQTPTTHIPSSPRSWVVGPIIRRRPLRTRPCVYVHPSYIQAWRSSDAGERVCVHNPRYMCTYGAGRDSGRPATGIGCDGTGQDWMDGCHMGMGPERRASILGAGGGGFRCCCCCCCCRQPRESHHIGIFSLYTHTYLSQMATHTWQPNATQPTEPLHAALH